MILPNRILLLVGFFLTHQGIANGLDDSGGNDFFESKIRPVFIEHCQKCHSEEAAGEKKLRGGLKLDSRKNWLVGGETGPAITPGKPSEGTLIASLKYEGEIKMPPKGKLPPSVISDFEKWIRDGAIDPRLATSAKTSIQSMDLKKGRQFWSLQPPVSPKIPESRDIGLGTPTPIDSFVQAKWKELNLKPVPPADKRTLIRRSYFDLTGMPPSPEEIEAFERDLSPEAFSKVIDRLLTSPRYGERWARHWLDVARYAEDQAHTFSVKPKTNAYLYRDWVIQAFNQDMPYNRFVKLQIAGDLIPASEEKDIFTRLAGLGFIGLGADYYKNTAREQAIAEELDDRVDTLTRGFLGLTVSCARCHDHKFDPIPTLDYYSIAGIYYGTELSDAPLVGPEVLETYNQAQKQIRDQEERINQFLAQIRLTATRKAQGLAKQYLLASYKVRNERATVSQVAKESQLDPYFLERWVKFFDPANAGKIPEPLKEWQNRKYPSKHEDLVKLAETITNTILALDLEEILPPIGKNRKDNKGKPLSPLASALVIGDKAPLFVSGAEVEKRFLDGQTKPEIVALKAELENRKTKSPKAPLQAPVVSGNGRGMKVYIRGNPLTKGEDAPKGFLQVLARTEPPNARKEFTRLDLANAIADPDNPLTARVYVNRVWQGHFGRGLVNTPSNFGSLGERPSHPDLLDFLAMQFVKNGWSTKWLHRQIMLSSTYQLSSEIDSQNAKIDPGNIYLWRGNRRRLDVESWRDSLLKVAGNLDETMGGPTFDLNDPTSRRRTVYAKISRHELNGLLRLFDFPDANVTADRRSVTTVPQQQLFALNSEFMIHQAKGFAKRLNQLATGEQNRLTAGYQVALGRAPETGEMALAIEFLKLPQNPGDKLSRWEQLAQALLASNEFLYVD